MSLCISVFISFATHEPAHNLQGGLLVQCSATRLNRIRGSSAGRHVEAAEESVRVFFCSCALTDGAGCVRRTSAAGA